MKIKDSELKAILAEVEADLSKSLDAEVSKLSKADGEDAPPAKDEEIAPEASAPAAEESAPAAEMSAPPAEEASASAPEAPPAEGSAPPAEGAADPAQDDSISPEALQAEYAQLDPESLKAHYLAAKAALFAVMGAAEQSAAPAAPPEASAPMAPPAPEGSAPALKAEADMSAETKKANGGKIETVAKSEKSLSKSEKDELLALREQVALQDKLFELLNTPVRKAVTAVDYVAKSDVSAEKRVLSKSEVTEKLKVVTADPKLAKSDRELVNRFYSGTVSIDQIEHLLK